jgi:hypothetical protein
MSVIVLTLQLRDNTYEKDELRFGVQHIRECT